MLYLATSWNCAAKVCDIILSEGQWKYIASSGSWQAARFCRDVSSCALVLLDSDDCCFGKVTEQRTVRVQGEVGEPLGCKDVLVFFFFSFFFGLFMATSWHMDVPRLGVESELQIRAASAIYTTAHGNWVGLGIEPDSSRVLVRFVTAELRWELQRLGLDYLHETEKPAILPTFLLLTRPSLEQDGRWAKKERHCKTIGRAEWNDWPKL